MPEKSHNSIINQHIKDVAEGKTRMDIVPAIDTKQEQIDAARIELGSFNNKARTLESCIMDMRLESERLKKTIAEANQEIAITKNLVESQRVAIAEQKKTNDKLLAKFSKA